MVTMMVLANIDSPAQLFLAFLKANSAGEQAVWEQKSWGNQRDVMGHHTEPVTHLYCGRRWRRK